MSELNLYARFLDGRPLEAILSSTAAQIATLLNAIGREKASTTPAPGKWSPAEIVCHLADCELVFGFRLRQTLAEDAPTIQPFDQEKWAASYPVIAAVEALAAFSAFRAWNLRLIGAALPTAADRPVTHPERGTMTFLTIVETMAGHDLNHLAQLQRIAASAAC
ncbi:MAG: DinB family protein [Terracidiphilus sp.]